MGAEAVGAGLMTGSAALGVLKGNRARRQAKRELGAQREALGQQEARAKQESMQLNAKIQAAQAKVAAGQARANRARVRGGIFGEAETTPKPVSATLG